MCVMLDSDDGDAPPWYDVLMRTTVNVDEALLRQAKRRAGERGETLGSLVEEALRRVLAETEQRRPPVSLPVFSGDTGPVAGVDLTSKESIEEAIEEGVRITEKGVPSAKLR